MASSDQDTKTLRLFLMGGLGEEEETAVGERMLTDDDYLEHAGLLQMELIDDYLDGRLSPEDRYRFERYFLGSPLHQEKLRMARAFRAYIKTRPSSWFVRRRLELAIAAALILGMGYLAYYRLAIYNNDLRKGSAILSELYRTGRPIEARIASFNWAPAQKPRGAVRGPINNQSASGNAEDVQRERAQIFLEQSLHKHPGPASEHEYGLFLLTNGAFTDAVSHLSAAANKEPTNAEYHSDLGAALFEEGSYDLTVQKDQGTREINQAVDEFHQAIRLDPGFKPALFNIALCLEALGELTKAEEAWNQYLAKDPDSPWSIEAKQRLTGLKQQTENPSGHS